jgi:hypothetical protein
MQEEHRHMLNTHGIGSHCSVIVIQPIWIGTWCTLCLIAGRGHDRADSALLGRASGNDPVASSQQATVSLACGLALIALGLPRGHVKGRYAGWNRYIV